MSFLSIFIIAVGLSMDALAVSITCSLKCQVKKILLFSAFTFGFFQAFMPLIGYLFGHLFKDVILSIDHWIAFILLAIIGGKMVYEYFQEDDENNLDIIDVKKILLLGIATSIDALAVGVTFAFLNINIWSSIAIIGITTFIISFIGSYLGQKIGALIGKKGELFGGIVLIGIGLKILIEHLIE